MNANATEPIEEWSVVINLEEQYSLWPIHRDIPTGWANTGVSGPKEECLAYIREVKANMHPRSLKEVVSH